MRQLLLEAGAHTHTPQQMVTRLLGDPQALRPLQPLHSGAEPEYNAIPGMAGAVWGGLGPPISILERGPAGAEQQGPARDACGAGSDAEGERGVGPEAEPAAAAWGEVGGEREGRWGWVPQLGRDVWQDVDLLR